MTAQLTFAEYKASQGVNWSSLKRLRESPLKYRYGAEALDVDTTYRAMGRAVHALVFEPQLWEQDFAIYEGGDRRGKEWQSFKEANEGKTIFKPNEISDILGMSNAVLSNELVAPYLEGGVFEQSVQWTDPKTSIKCKGRLDWNNKSMGALLDLKTSTTINQFRFGRIAARLGYHVQLGGMYYDALQHGLGWEPQEVAFIVVESSAPYEVAFFYMDPDDLFCAQEEKDELLARLKIHQEADIWPGAYPAKQRLLLPEYVFGDGDEEDPTGLGIVFNSGV